MSAPLDITGILERAGADGNAPEGSQAWALAQVDAAIDELIEKSERFGLLFERWNRLDLEGVEPATESEVIEAMYAMRAALALVGGAK